MQLANNRRLLVAWFAGYVMIPDCLAIRSPPVPAYLCDQDGAKSTKGQQGGITQERSVGTADSRARVNLDCLEHVLTRY